MSCDSRIVPCGQVGGRTDITNLIAAFRNFATAPKIIQRNANEIVDSVVWIPRTS
jgi:hypothetical protein